MTLPSTQPVYSTLGADPDLGELVEMFASEMPDRIDNLLRLYNGEDREEFRRAVHKSMGPPGAMASMPLLRLRPVWKYR